MLTSRLAGFAALFACLCLGLPAYPAKAGPITLVENGQARAVVVLRDDAGARSLERRAAELLTQMVERMTGSRLPVVRVGELQVMGVREGRLTAAVPIEQQNLPGEELLGDEHVPGEQSAAAAQAFVLIGQSSLTDQLGVTADGLGMGGIRVKTTANTLTLLGGPATVDGQIGQDPSGLQHAVMEVLHQLGATWLWPNETGLVLPQGDTLIVPAIDVTYTPPIVRRGIRWGRWSERSDRGVEHMGLSRQQIEQWQQTRIQQGDDDLKAAEDPAVSWLNWHRQGGRMPSFGHAGGGLRDGERHLKENPDWFALQADGTRDQGGDNRWRLCHSNPQLIEHVANDIIARVNEDPSLTLVALDFNDGGSNTGFCLCERCAALDPADAPRIGLTTFGEPVRPNSTTRRRLRIDHASLSDRMVWYWSSIAQRVTQVHPKLKLGISVYSAWTHPPVREKLHPNLVARYVPGTTEHIDGWRQAGLKEVFWRPNILLFNRRDGKLKSVLGDLVDAMHRFHELGIRQTDFDSIGHNWATAGLSYYAAARLNWDPTLTADQIIEEYTTRGFGAGASYIAAYFRRVEELTTKGIPGSHQTANDFTYTPKVTAELRSLLNQAQQAAGNDQAIIDRIAFLRLGLNMTELHETLDDLARRTREKDPTVDAEQARQLLDLNYLVMLNMMVRHELVVNVPRVTWGSGGYAKWRPLPGNPAQLSDESLLEKALDPQLGLTGQEQSINDLFAAFGLSYTYGTADMTTTPVTHASATPQSFLSHPTLRPFPELKHRAMEQAGQSYFVDAKAGSDKNDGSQAQPWRTIQHALPYLQPGDTLYLREGTYFEQVYCAVAGTRENPITIRAYPGERVILDGSIPEFQTSPQTAWEPYPQGREDEYVSTNVYRNIRDVVGIFGDSHVGLQTYWHAEDMRADNEMWIPNDEQMVDYVYCGPGIWYNRMTGRIHARLAHTHIDNPEVDNYRGVTDPRQVPLIIAAFRSSALMIDQAMNLKLQDLIIRGGGHDTVVSRLGVNIEMDNVTIYAGTYGLRAFATGPFKMVHSAIHGMIAPWMFRTENSLYGHARDYYDPFLKEFPSTKTPEAVKRRNIARLPTHAVLVTEDGAEYDVFRYPMNHDWDIAHSEFTDSHDGVYLSGTNIHFRHNWVDSIQDDALYLSGPNPNINQGIYVYQNLITRSLLAFGYHSRGGPAGDTYVFRNVVDFRAGTNATRPTPDNPSGIITNYHVHLMHGRQFLGVENVRYYHNTLISPANRRSGFLHRLSADTSPITSRTILNNLLVYLNDYPPAVMRGHNIISDGNLHWSAAQPAPADYLDRVRTSEAAAAALGMPIKAARITPQHRMEVRELEPWPHVWEARSIVAEPGFNQFEASPTAGNDYRLSASSPAVGAGVVLPSDLPDPLRPLDNSQPDIGAIPVDAPAPTWGRWGRVALPIAGLMQTPDRQPDFGQLGEVVDTSMVQ